MNPRFILLSTLLGGASLLRSTGAHAAPAPVPGITDIASPVTRLEPNGVSADGASGNPHPAGVAFNLIDLEDCNADLKYDFTLDVANLSDSYNFNAWVGTQDCTPLSSRQAATAACWPVGQPIAAVATPLQVQVRMRDIVSQAFETTHDLLYTPAPDIVADPAPTLCKMQGGLPPEPLFLYFFFADAEGNAVGTAQPYPLTVDLVANPTPVTEPDGGATDGGSVQTSGGGNGCTVAAGPSSPSSALTLAFAVGTVALVRRRQRATGTRRGSASRSSSRSA